MINAKSMSSSSYNLDVDESINISPRKKKHKKKIVEPELEETWE